MVFLCWASSHGVTRVNDSTRVTIFGDSDSTRVMWRTIVTRLESRFSQNDSNRVTINDSSQSHFYKISEPLMDKPIFWHKKWAFFASVLIKTDANLLFWLSRRVMLHFKDQVFPTSTEVELQLCFSLNCQQGTRYWHVGLVFICISWSLHWASYCYFEFIANKVIEVF